MIVFTQDRSGQGIRITGSNVAVLEIRFMDADAVANVSTSTNFVFEQKSTQFDEGWDRVIEASAGTSLSFLEREPDLYDDDDGEPV